MTRERLERLASSKSELCVFHANVTADSKRT